MTAAKAEERPHLSDEPPAAVLVGRLNATHVPAICGVVEDVETASGIQAVGLGHYGPLLGACKESMQSGLDVAPRVERFWCLCQV